MPATQEQQQLPHMEMAGFHELELQNCVNTLDSSSRTAKDKLIHIAGCSPRILNVSMLCNLKFFDSCHTQARAQNVEHEEAEHKDGSSAANGNINNRGGWKTMPYIIANEACEKLATLGLLANMIVYLTTQFNMKNVAASNVLNTWSGTTNFSPLIGAFFVRLLHRPILDNCCCLYRISNWNDNPDAHGHSSRAAGERTLRSIYLQWTAIFLFKVGYLVFLLAFSLLSTAAVVYTVACMYTAKDVSYGKVMAVVPKVWKRLMVTFLWFFAIMLAYNTAFVFAVLFLILAVGVANLNSGAFIAGLVILVIVFFAVHVYISAIWHLASVISVLEDKYGIGAMEKSRHLIVGKRTPAFVLIVVYFVICGGIGAAFGIKVLHGNRHGVGVMYRAGYATILIALLSLVNLMGLLVQSVFYFVCKSYHHQSIDKSALSDHLEVYLGEYVPLKGSVQLENF